MINTVKYPGITFEHVGSEMSELLASGLIAFRESFEAAIIISLIVATYKKLNIQGYKKPIIIGTIGSLILGIVIALGILYLYGSFSQKSLFEGLLSIIAAVILTSVVYWMAKNGKNIAEDIKARASKSLSFTSIVALITVVVGREAVETVLLVSPYMISDTIATIGGVIIGILAAITLSYMIYKLGLKLNLRTMFLATSIMLVMIASGLLGQGIHELIEYSEEKGIELGIIEEKAYDLGLPRDHPLNSKGVLGSIFSVLVGYSDSMEWGRLIGQVAYLIVGLYMVLRAYNII